MNIAYFGSPEIAASVLQELNSSPEKDIQIELVVTQPDRPAGKKLQLQPTKVKEYAVTEKIPLFDKELSTSLEELIHTLRTKNIELGIIYAYGAYLPKELLTIPIYGFINVHFSLLPKYRGASPIAYPIIMADKETGVTLIQVNEELDGGHIISQKKTEILAHDTRIQLESRLTEISKKMTIEHIINKAQGKNMSLQSQNMKDVTYTGLLKKSDGYISLTALKKSLKNEPLRFNEVPRLIQNYTSKYPNSIHPSYYEKSAQLVYNYYRGLYKWPGIWTTIETPQGIKRLKITRLGFSTNVLNIELIQLEGKNEVEFNTFNKAYNIF